LFLVFFHFQLLIISNNFKIENVKFKISLTILYEEQYLRWLVQNFQINSGWFRFQIGFQIENISKFLIYFQISNLEIIRNFEVTRTKLNEKFLIIKYYFY